MCNVLVCCMYNIVRSFLPLSSFTAMTHFKKQPLRCKQLSDLARVSQPLHTAQCRGPGVSALSSQPLNKSRPTFPFPMASLPPGHALFQVGRLQVHLHSGSAERLLNPRRLSPAGLGCFALFSPVAFCVAPPIGIVCKAPTLLSIMYKALKHLLIGINTTCSKMEGHSVTWVEMFGA